MNEATLDKLRAEVITLFVRLVEAVNGADRRLRREMITLAPPPDASQRAAESYGHWKKGMSDAKSIYQPAIDVKEEAVRWLAAAARELNTSEGNELLAILTARTKEPQPAPDPSQ